MTMNNQNKRFEGLPHRQRGLTAIAMVLILAMAGFFAMIAIRLFPIYLEHFSVKKHLENVSKETGIKEKTNREILTTLDKRFQIDDVKHVTHENIFIEREKGGPMTIAIEYEVRTPAVANVEMIVSFVDEVEID
jgi:hypothetical protein